MSPMMRQARGPMSVAAALVGLALVLACPAAAAAQPDAEAHGLYQAGAAAFADGRFDEALELFQRAYARSPRVELLYNVGQAADRARRDDVALDAFRRYLAERPDDVHAVEIEGRIRVLERTLAERDAATVAETPAPTEVPPIDEASDVATEQEGEPDEPSAPLDVVPASSIDAGGVVLAVTGGVIAVVGGVLIGVAVPDLVPPRPGLIYAREVERQVQAEALTVAGGVALGLGVVGAIVGGVLLGAGGERGPLRVDGRGVTVVF